MRLIIVECPMYPGISGDIMVDAGAPEDIEGNAGLWRELILDTKIESWVGSTEAGNDVVLNIRINVWIMNESLQAFIVLLLKFGHSPYVMRSLRVC